MRLTNLIAAAAIATSAMASTAFAGGFAAVVVEPIVTIVEPMPTRSTWGIILPLVGVALLIALAAANEEDDPAPGTGPTPTPVPTE